MKKNVASQVVGAQMVTAADGTAFTGSVTVAVTGDGGTQATGSVGSGACTHKGNGYHSYAPAQAETNYDHIAFTFTGTGAVPATVQIYTDFPQTGDAYGGTPSVNAVQINSSASAAAQLALSAAAIVSGAAEATPSTTVIQTDLAETQDDIYIGRSVIFTSGAAAGEMTEITDYTGSTGTLTVTALANAPSASDTFIIV